MRDDTTRSIGDNSRSQQQGVMPVCCVEHPCKRNDLVQAYVLLKRSMPHVLGNYHCRSNYSNVLISGTAYLIILFLPNSLNVDFPGHSA